VREFEVMRGNGVKRPASSERTTRTNNRKSVVLKHRVKANQRLTREHLTVKRPGHGIAPKDMEKVIGRRVIPSMDADTVLTWEDLS
jgi:N-acetylneuraminate synthase